MPHSSTFARFLVLSMGVTLLTVLLSHGELKDMFRSLNKAFFARLVQLLVYGLVVVWPLAFVLPLPEAVDPVGWGRLFFATGLFILPGALAQVYVYREENFQLSSILTVGFTVSVGVSGIVGLLAKTIQLPLVFVVVGLWVFGMVMLIAVLRLPSAPSFPALNWDRETLLALLFLVITLALVSVLSMAELHRRPVNFSTDDYTFNALIAKFTDAKQLNSTPQILDIEADQTSMRNWMINWPIVESVIVKVSNLHTIQFYLWFHVPLVLLALIAVYDLARTLGLSREAAIFSVTAQACLLILMTENNDQIGFRWLIQLTHGKSIVAFIIAPVFFRVCINYLITHKQRYISLLILIGLGSQAIHITLSTIMLSIALGFVLLSFVFKRQARVIAIVVAVIVIIAFIPAPLRFLDATNDERNFDIADAQEDDKYSKNRSHRLWTLDNERFYGLNVMLLVDFSYILVFLAAMVALLKLRNHLAAVFVTTTMLLLLFVLNPYTGWLLGLAITPFHIWRVTWFIPFGIATAFMVETASKQTWFKQRSFAIYLIPAASTILFLITVTHLPPWFSRGHLTFNLSTDYDALVQAGNWLDYETEGDIVIVGDSILNNHVPALAEQVYVITFRTERMTQDWGNLSPQEVSRRNEDRTALLDFETDTAERWEIIERYGIDFLIFTTQPTWISSMHNNERAVRPVASFNDHIFLYGVVPITK